MKLLPIQFKSFSSRRSSWELGCRMSGLGGGSNRPMRSFQCLILRPRLLIDTPCRAEEIAPIADKKYQSLTPQNGNRSSGASARPSLQGGRGQWTST